jgi:hypothetical protein
MGTFLLLTSLFLKEKSQKIDGYEENPNEKSEDMMNVVCFQGNLSESVGVLQGAGHIFFSSDPCMLFFSFLVSAGGSLPCAASFLCLFCPLLCLFFTHTLVGYLYCVVMLCAVLCCAALCCVVLLFCVVKSMLHRWTVNFFYTYG